VDAGCDLAEPGGAEQAGGLQLSPGQGLSITPHVPWIINFIFIITGTIQALETRVGKRKYKIFETG
jgi:hypothetical protein